MRARYSTIRFMDIDLWDDCILRNQMEKSPDNIDAAIIRNLELCLGNKYYSLSICNFRKT